MYHSLVGDLEGPGARHLIENFNSLIFIWYQVAIEVEGQIAFGDLVPQNEGVRQASGYGARN